MPTFTSRGPRPRSPAARRVRRCGRPRRASLPTNRLVESAPRAARVGSLGGTPGAEAGMASERTAMSEADPFAPTLEQREIADLAFALGAKYADRRFDDHEASLAQWEDLRSSGLTGLSLPEEHGGAG